MSFLHIRLFFLCTGLLLRRAGRGQVTVSGPTGVILPSDYGWRGFAGERSILQSGRLLPWRTGRSTALRCRRWLVCTILFPYSLLQTLAVSVRGLTLIILCVKGLISATAESNTAFTCSLALSW